MEHRGGRGIWTTPSSEEKGLGQAGAHLETDDLLEFVHFEKSLIRQPFSQKWAGCRTSYRGCCSAPGLTMAVVLSRVRGVREGGADLEPGDQRDGVRALHGWRQPA